MSASASTSASANVDVGRTVLFCILFIRIYQGLKGV